MHVRGFTKMVNRTLFIGDLHGKYEIVEAALASDYEKIVFMGDYVDSFSKTPQDQLKTLDLVLGAIKENPERVTGLLGNHELSYIFRAMQCSGWNEDMQEEINKRDLRALKDYTWVGKYLASHAGVSNRLVKHMAKGLDEYLEREDFFQIGRARGGWSKVGGLFWNDWFQEFDPLEDTPQIVGHSGYRIYTKNKGILEKDGSFNVDCLDHVKEFLVIEDDEPKIITLEHLKNEHPKRDTV